MNRVICLKGHFYDGDKYETCPHCAAGAEAIRQDAFSVRHSEMEEKKTNGRKNEEKSRREKGGFFHRGEKKEAVYMPADNQAASAVHGTVLLREAEKAGYGFAPEQKADAASGRNEIGQAAVGRGVTGGWGTTGGQGATGGWGTTGGQGATGQGAIEQEVKKSQESVSQSLRYAFAASAGADEKADEGKTVGFFSAGRTEPPAGYLICTSGEDYGIGFPLKTGNNSIGRSASMDVVLLDAKVSREKQAFVMYEPLKREFYLRPGEGTGLCYLNGELVLGPVKIKAFDLIMLGDTKLMLIPVCCDRFSWEEVE